MGIFSFSILVGIFFMLSGSRRQWTETDVKAAITEYRQFHNMK